MSLGENFDAENIIINFLMRLIGVLENYFETLSTPQALRLYSNLFMYPSSDGSPAV